MPPVVHTRQFIGVAEAVSLPPLSETVVAVQADVAGPHLLESLDKIYHRKQVTMSNGIANLQRNVPVAVKIANMSRATSVKPGVGAASTQWMSWTSELKM